MPKHTVSGAPKKARWTPAEKKAAAGAKKPHRGQAARSTSPGTAHVGGREWRAPRDERRPFERRDDRPSFERRERPSFERRDDRGARPFERRDDRPSFERRERPSFERRDDRGSRPAYDRDSRPAYDRDSRPAYDRRDDRGSRPAYDRRDDRGGRPAYDRDSRPAYDRRDDRGGRPAYDRGYDRGGRPAYDRDSRPAYDRGGNRGARPSFDRRDERGPAPRSDRRGDWSGDRFAQDAEAERLEADTWTKATRADVSDGPVEVAQDNGFAALGLPERLVERLAREGITTPFPIQTAAIPDALAGRDVLGRGQTGSGKTLAFGLPMIARLLEAGTRSAPRRPRALVLVPTRELAMQVSDALEPLVHVVGLRHKLVAGGLSYTTQINALNRGVDILIATPGRLNDLLERGAVEMGDVRITVLDEADHMAEMGFLPEISTSLDLIPTDGQRLLFSATLDNGIDTLVERYLHDPVTHSTDDATASVETMEHHVLLIDPMHKKAITAEVANRAGRTVVFCRTKLGADRIAGQLREQGVMAAALHGGLNQGARNRVLGAFRDGTLPVLVATDVAARGIHVDDVSVVLQVDPPADHKDYLHRSGRTARAGDRGTVVTLALPHQRRTMERQLRDAGVDIVPVKAAPGDDILAATGATAPSGVPIPEEDFQRLLQGPRPHRGGPAGSRGPRHERSGARPHSGGRPDRGDRRGRDDRWARDDRRGRGERPDRGDRLVTRWGDDDGRRGGRS